MPGAPMFAHAVATGELCQACRKAGRWLIRRGPLSTRDVHVRMDVLDVAGATWQACVICDQNPLDAPAWRCT